MKLSEWMIAKKTSMIINNKNKTKILAKITPITPPTTRKKASKYSIFTPPVSFRKLY